MVQTPREIPVATPDPEPINTIDELELDHVPPEVASVKVIFAPKPTDDGPAIAAGPVVTVTTLVPKQPLAL
jgi:hypothetical protein